MSLTAVTGGEGLAVLFILYVATGGSGLSSMPEGVYWDQIAMRSLSVSLGP